MEIERADNRKQTTVLMPRTNFTEFHRRRVNGNSTNRIVVKTWLKTKLK